MVTLCVYGSGRIGGCVANLAASLGIIDSLVIFDINTPFLHAQKLDLLHADRGIPVSTDLSLMPGCDICLFTAGLPRDPTVETRTALLDSNISVAKDFINHLAGFTGILITVTNPVDCLNNYFQKKTGLPRERVIGFGGQLDSARFTCNLHEKGISGKGIVLGQHGEYQVPVFSHLEANLSAEMRQTIHEELKNASMEVIKGKGATEYGPCWHITRLINAVAEDTKERLICSCVLDGEYGIEGCSLGVPAIIGAEGIISIEEWPLDADEQEGMKTASQYIKNVCRNII